MKNNTYLFSLGFRPFFFISAFFAFLLMSAWAAVYLFSYQLSSFNYYPMVIWHSHEMIFGYSMAVIAGFLLTAIKNWTGIQTVSGIGLMLLTAIWIAGRVIPFVVDLPLLIAFIDILFLPVLAIFVATPLIKAGNKRNYFVIVLVSIFAILNMFVHLDLLGVINNVAANSLKVAFYLIIALIVLMAGRVFPMFSQNGVASRYQVKRYGWIEKLALPSYFVFVISMVYIKINIIVLLASLLATVVHSIRLKGWYNSQIWQVPLIWVLHIGYLFLIVGFITSAISLYHPEFYFMSLHVFSIGVIGMITIGMMARVSVGHTGRDLRFPPKIIKVSFYMILLAVIVRSILPMFVSDVYIWTIIVSGVFWATAFLLFFLSYAKMWIEPRVKSG